VSGCLETNTHLWCVTEITSRTLRVWLNMLYVVIPNTTMALIYIFGFVLFDPCVRFVHMIFIGLLLLGTSNKPLLGIMGKEWYFFKSSIFTLCKAVRGEHYWIWVHTRFHLTGPLLMHSITPYTYLTQCRFPMAGVLVGVSSLGPISEWFLLGPNNYFLATPSNLP
jgi:hypothetical protein